MKYSDEELRKILLEGAYVSEEDLQKSESFAKENHGSLLDYLYSEQLINSGILGQAIAEHLHVGYYDISHTSPTKELVTLIPEKFAREHHAVVVEKKEEDIKIASSEPESDELIKGLGEIFPKSNITLFFSFEQDVDRSFSQYKTSLEARFVSIIEKEQHVAPEILNEIISDAQAFHASDIHLEPLGETVRIRFRVDGVLHEAGSISAEHYASILNRIKVQANLRIDEHASTQDGAIRLSQDGHNLDLRVSVIPTLDGEKVAIRLLSEYVRGFTVNDLGLSEGNKKILLKASHKPFGMILVVGPTGSGKTTTLYSLLKILHTPDVNITTIEDPVEYKIKGINQVQVNAEANITFADGLRSIARQDPDIILVGEIRDVETSQIAVNAALTGHLMLSTFHANDAATAIPRLLDMGVEPFLVASSLELIIAQRLMRRLCSACRYSYSVPIKELESSLEHPERFFHGKTTTLYKGKGCPSCNGTGYKGRIALFEFISNSPEMQDLILKNPSIKQIWELARSQGAQSMFEDGLRKVVTGVSTLEELLRVAPPPEIIIK